MPMIGACGKQTAYACGILGSTFYGDGQTLKQRTQSFVVRVVGVFDSVGSFDKILKLVEAVLNLITVVADRVNAQVKSVYKDVKTFRLYIAPTKAIGGLFRIWITVVGIAHGFKALVNNGCADNKKSFHFPGNTATLDQATPIIKDADVGEFYAARQQKEHDKAGAAGRVTPGVQAALTMEEKTDAYVDYVATKSPNLYNKLAVGLTQIKLAIATQVTEICSLLPFTVAFGGCKGANFAAHVSGQPLTGRVKDFAATMAPMMFINHIASVVRTILSQTLISLQWKSIREKYRAEERGGLSQESFLTGLDMIQHKAAGDDLKPNLGVQNQRKAEQSRNKLRQQLDACYAKDTTIHVLTTCRLGFEFVGDSALFHPLAPLTKAIGLIGVAVFDNLSTLIALGRK